MPSVWVVRLGEGGRLADRCRERGVIAIGFEEVGELTPSESYEGLRNRVYERRRDQYDNVAGAGVVASMLWYFLHDMAPGDIVLSPKRETRELLVGIITGPYTRNPSTVDADYPNLRTVEWRGVVPYENIPREIWRSMTALQTLFRLSTPDALDAARRLAEGLRPGTAQQPVETPEGVTPPAIVQGQQLFDETEERSALILAAHFDSFTGIEFQSLVWATLKAAGLHPKPMRRGRDRGVDIEAYRDPLQLGPPRILVQVKHRDGQTSGREMAEFIGRMNREGDVGMYVSTGGFTADARHEAESSRRPITLMGWEQFVELFLEMYDRLDNATKALVPIDTVRILIRHADTEQDSWISGSGS
jgi:restriction system protein